MSGKDLSTGWKGYFPTFQTESPRIIKISGRWIKKKIRICMSHSNLEVNSKEKAESWRHLNAVVLSDLVNYMNSLLWCKKRMCLRFQAESFLNTWNFWSGRSIFAMQMRELWVGPCRAAQMGWPPGRGTLWWEVWKFQPPHLPRDAEDWVQSRSINLTYVMQP